MLPFSGWLNREYRFHDPSIDGFVQSAWHAVAIDERRKLFPPELFGDVTSLNTQQGFANDDPKAPYQERWFPGVHGSVGGGGDIRGLSDAALAWILLGAKRAGLRLDTARGTRIHSFEPDALAPLINEKRPERSATQMLQTDRQGPENLWQLSKSAVRRWRSPADRLGGSPYRPATLQGVSADLDALGTDSFSPPADLVATERVMAGDSLSLYARRHYGDAELWPEIYQANLDVLDDPDEIFPGQAIRIPVRSAVTRGSSAPN
jgi:nucleoid-associated protein YgaU